MIVFIFVRIEMKQVVAAVLLLALTWSAAADCMGENEYGSYISYCLGNMSFGFVMMWLLTLYIICR